MADSIAVARARTRDHIVALVRERIESGSARPMLVPHCLVGNFIIPILYLTVPHANRPLLHRARYLVFAVVALMNVYLARTTQSANAAVACIAGISSAWGTIWAFTALICLRPHFDVERVQKRPRARWHRGRDGTTSFSRSPSSSPMPPPRRSASALRSRTASPAVVDLRRRRSKSVRFLVPPDEDVARALAEDDMEYFWQAFPAEAPFGDRLGWAYDYYTAWRGVGWNFAISPVPSFAPPRVPLSGELVSIESIPVSTIAGFSRPLTEHQFLLIRIGAIIFAYIAVDLSTTLMSHDPYFHSGSHSPSTPLLYVRRCALLLVPVVLIIEAMFSIDQVLRRYVTILIFGRGVRTELWQHPSIFGNFSSILDRGLVGFWGAWHQTFRLGFTAPTAWLLGEHTARHTTLGRWATATAAFMISGAMHATGSYTLPLPTRPASQWLFFALAWVGVSVQECGYRLLRLGRLSVRLPRPVRRAANLAFVTAWMLLTCWAFFDDMARGGVFLFETVPYSSARELGLGPPGDADPIRWRGPAFVVFKGKHWWEVGIGL